MDDFRRVQDDDLLGAPGQPLVAYVFYPGLDTGNNLRQTLALNFDLGKVGKHSPISPYCMYTAL
eukprot:4490691-Pyramimonas_sp.AAC.2